MVDELTGKRIVEVAAADMNTLKDVLGKFHNVADIKMEDGHWVFSTTQSLDAAALNKHLAGEGIYVTHLVQRSLSLEQGFLEKLNEA